MLSSASPVLALDTPVRLKEKADAQPLKNPTITEVDAPKAGKPFDVTAKVTADDGVSFESPVFWLGTPGTGVKWDCTVTLTEPDGKTRQERISYIETQGENAEKAVNDAFYMPVLAFFLPDQYTCDGKVTLDKNLSDLFEMTGGVMTIEEPSTDITYITGMITGLTKIPPEKESQKNTGKPSAEPSGNEVPDRTSDDPSDAPDQDAASAAADISPEDDAIDAEQSAQGAEAASISADAGPADEAIAAA